MRLGELNYLINFKIGFLFYFNGEEYDYADYNEGEIEEMFHDKIVTKMRLDYEYRDEDYNGLVLENTIPILEIHLEDEIGLVKKLREKLGVSVLEAKAALKETNWEYYKAIEWLREKAFGTKRKGD